METDHLYDWRLYDENRPRRIVTGLLVYARVCAEDFTKNSKRDEIRVQSL